MRGSMTGMLMLSLVSMASLARAETKSSPAPTRVAATSAATARPVLHDGWPDTRPGAIGRGWVAAFSTGPAAMREFYTRELTAESLAKKSADQRLDKYRSLREKFGKLTFASVVESGPSELKAKLIDSDGESHTFVFTLQSEAPYKLLTVGMLETRMHGGFGGFHH